MLSILALVRFDRGGTATDGVVIEQLGEHPCAHTEGTGRAQHYTVAFRVADQPVATCELRCEHDLTAGWG